MKFQIALAALCLSAVVAEFLHEKSHSLRSASPHAAGNGGITTDPVSLHPVGGGIVEIHHEKEHHHVKKSHHEEMKVAKALEEGEEASHEEEHAAHHGHGHHEEHKEAAHHGHHEEHAEGPHHGHKEGAHPGHHGHEEAPDAVESFSLGLLLLGSVSSLMMLFYLVNSSHVGVRNTTWRVLNLTVSIFIAVLLYGTMRMVIFKVLQPTFYQQITITLTLFVMLFVGTDVLLFKLKDLPDKSHLEAASTVMGHVTGFAAMYGFADSHEVAMFQGLHSDGILLIIFFAAFFIMALTFICDKILLKQIASDGIIDEDEKEWVETCDETADDVFCLAISFLTVLLIRFLVRGEAMPYAPGHLGHITQAHANGMMYCIFGFLALVLIGVVAIIRNHEKIASNKLLKRVTTTIQHLNSMTLAWLMLFWAEWQLYVAGWDNTVIGGCLFNAIFLTMGAFGLVKLLDLLQQSAQTKVAKRAAESVELALGVLVGFSWERAFDVAFEELEHNLNHNPKYSVGGGTYAGAVGVTISSIILLAIVAPAWRLYILPKAMATKKDDETCQGEGG